MIDTFKIVFKKDPIFKYIVDDYPFYEGLYFHSVDYHKMKILSSHCLLRQKLSTNQGGTHLFCSPKYCIHTSARFNSSQIKFQIIPKFKLKLQTKFHDLNNSKFIFRFTQRLTMHEKTYSKDSVKLHMIKTVKLKTHDLYTLENRDNLTLSEMDGEKFL